MPSRYERRREERRKGITRRDFNRIAVLMITFHFATKGILNLIDRSTVPTQTALPTVQPTKEAEIPGELMALMGEIQDYRSVLKLPGLPRELGSEDALNAALNYDRDAEFPDFSMELPEHERSFAMRTKDVLEKVFGKNFNRLIDSVTANGQPGHQEFNSVSRNINLTVDLHEMYNLDTGFDGLVLHEGQHGIHPALHKGLYPLDQLVKVSHGIWRALSKTSAYEKNLYGGLIFPSVKRQITEAIAKKFVEDINLQGQVDLRGYSHITSLLSEIAAKKSVKIEQLKFSKKVCAELGEKLFDLILSGEITLQGDLQSEWIRMMEGGLIEIIADMFEAAILDPEKIGHDADVIGGVEEMMSAIQGRKVTVGEIRELLKEIPAEVLVRHEGERAFLYPESPMVQETVIINETPYAVPTLTSDELTDIKEYQETQQGTQDIFNDFITYSELPVYYSETLTADQLNVMEEYGKAVSAVYARYPTIFEAVSGHNMSFDPELHIWETRDIAVATDPNVIWNLLSDPTLVPDYLDRIRSRTEVLVGFINNEAAFGTNNYTP